MPVAPRAGSKKKVCLAVILSYETCVPHRIGGLNSKVVGPRRASSKIKLAKQNKVFYNPAGYI